MLFAQYLLKIKLQGIDTAISGIWSYSLLLDCLKHIPTQFICSKFMYWLFIEYTEQLIEFIAIGALSFGAIIFKYQKVSKFLLGCPVFRA